MIKKLSTSIFFCLETIFKREEFFLINVDIMILNLYTKCTRIPRMTIRHCWISASRTKLMTICFLNPALRQGHLMEVRYQRLGQARSVKLRRRRVAVRTLARLGPFPGIVTGQSAEASRRNYTRFFNLFATIVKNSFQPVQTTQLNRLVRIYHVHIVFYTFY